MKKESKYGLIVFAFSFTILSMRSHSISNDWVSAIVHAFVGGFIITFTFIMGHTIGLKDGESIGYEKNSE